MTDLTSSGQASSGLTSPRQTSSGQTSIASELPQRETIGEQRHNWWEQFDPFITVAAIAVAVFGVVLVYSATRGDLDPFQPTNTDFLNRQALFVCAGVVLASVAAWMPAELIGKLWPGTYAGVLIALVIVAIIGVEVSGTRGWFELGSFRFQPSEPAKLVTIIGMAWLLSPARNAEVTRTRLAAAIGICLTPIALVLLQPDLGTMLVYVVIAFAMVVTSGVRTRMIVLLALVAATAIVGVFRSEILEGYQQARLTVFLFAPEQVDEQAAAYAYNAEQAQIAIGNGGITGQGLFNGTQTRSQLVPAQQTDFIFTVAGEELGLRGAGLLLGLYVVMLFRIWRTAATAGDSFDRLMCVGILAMFLFQMFQAVGMTMGMMPVTGIPLPLVSYGGSSMLTSLAALGIVAGVYRRRLAIN